MKTVVLDGSLSSVGQVRDRLVRDLGLPIWTGRNVDALWDALTTEAAGPFTIVWRNHLEAEKHLGSDYQRLVKLFRDVAAERPDARIVLD